MQLLNVGPRKNTAELNLALFWSRVPPVLLLGGPLYSAVAQKSFICLKSPVVVLHDCRDKNNLMNIPFLFHYIQCIMVSGFLVLPVWRL